MSAAPTGIIASDIGDFSLAWSSSFGVVIGQITGSPTSFEVAAQAPSELTPAPAENIWVLATCSGKLSGEMAFRLPVPHARRLAQLFVGEAQDSGTDITEEHREALLELFRQTAGHAATALKGQGREVQVRMELAQAPTWTSGGTTWLVAQLPAIVSIEISISAALAAVLRAPQSRAQEDAGPGPAGADKRLGLLLDVELAVTLRFGGKRMLLKDILELDAGSVVELDQQVHEPIDLLLEGRPIARGEVVVVDGNYGLRVTELMPAKVH